MADQRRGVTGIIIGIMPQGVVIMYVFIGRNLPLFRPLEPPNICVGESDPLQAHTKQCQLLEICGRSVGKRVPFSWHANMNISHPSLRERGVSLVARPLKLSGLMPSWKGFSMRIMPRGEDGAYDIALTRPVGESRYVVFMSFCRWSNSRLSPGFP